MMMVVKSLVLYCMVLSNDILSFVMIKWWIYCVEEFIYIVMFQ